MRAIWKGAISFGLVNIPIALYPATRAEEMKFRLLRAKDMSPVNYKRVAEADGKEVPWVEIVKWYEYEKGKFVVLKDEDFKRVDIEATQTVDIEQFVQLAEVNPVFFHKPYYMEPMKGGDKAYVLLREALSATGKIAIARVVIKTRQHLAAVKPQEKGLMLELMHFAAELIDVDEFKMPQAKTAGKNELEDGGGADQIDDGKVGSGFLCRRLPGGAGEIDRGKGPARRKSGAGGGNAAAGQGGQCHRPGLRAAAKPEADRE